MKKQDLYDLIEERYAKSVKNLQENFFKGQEQLAVSYYSILKDRIKTVEVELKNFVTALENFDIGFSVLGDQAYYVNRLGKYRNVVQNGTDLIKYMEEQIRQRFVNVQHIKISDEFNLIPEAVKYFEKHNKQLVVYKAEKEKLDTLKRELNYVVKSFPSAKQAAKKLEELGLDLSDLEEVRAENLPAVIKTSVDVCLFNKGGCE